MCIVGFRRIRNNKKIFFVQTGVHAQDQTHQQAHGRENIEPNVVVRIGGDEQETLHFETLDPNAFPIVQPSVTFEHTLNQPADENELYCNNAAAEADMMRHEEEKQQQQREKEINAAIRCLTTNFCLCLVFFILSLSMSVLNQIQVVALTALCRSFVPIVATISNFVKIHTLLMETFINWKLKVSAKLNDMRVFG